jgi:hypothetical protein
VAYSKLDEQGEEHDVWITYTSVNANIRHGGPTPRINLFTGPDKGSPRLPGGKKSIDLMSFIDEMDMCHPWRRPRDWGYYAFLLWKNHYSLVETPPLEVTEEEEEDWEFDDSWEYENTREYDDTMSRKRRRCDESASHAGYDTGSAQAEHDTYRGELNVIISEIAMTDDEIIDAFDDLDTPVSEFVVYRMAGILKAQKETRTLPPLSLVRGLRDEVNPTTESDMLRWEISARSPGISMEGSLAHFSRRELEEMYCSQEQVTHSLEKAIRIHEEAIRIHEETNRIQKENTRRQEDLTRKQRDFIRDQGDIFRSQANRIRTLQAGHRNRYDPSPSVPDLSTTPAST